MNYVKIISSLKRVAGFVLSAGFLCLIAALVPYIAVGLQCNSDPTSPYWHNTIELQCLTPDGSLRTVYITAIENFIDDWSATVILALGFCRLAWRWLDKSGLFRKA